MDNDEFIKALAGYGVVLDDAQLSQFDAYFNYLVEWNQKFNLTAITDHDEVYLKHFFDSLTLAFFVPTLQEKAVSLIDIGAGAGFPSVPLKIAFPQLKITMVDALAKRVNFLNGLIEHLGLTGIEAVHGRAEDLGHDRHYRGQFDYATARAVARTSVLAEYTLPFVKADGELLVMKGAAAQTELSDGQAALAALGGQLVAEEHFELPNHDERYIQVVKKVGPTPKKYPRQAGTPNKKPIQ
ncbi:16S rRNA (guanine(527)-N(7))-methyltransferase RsmG [Leuconostocaceae bacterium ESL0723]|nr:16S rRNA (guanine(527)-N(7))-methyltransferase RsmG [Leuconostocaceae bacterium ESL0723]